MSKQMRIGLIICGAGLGVTVGALAPVLAVPFTVILAVGLGIIIGGVFGTLRHIQREIKEAKEAINKMQSGS